MNTITGHTPNHPCPTTYSGLGRRHLGAAVALLLAAQSCLAANTPATIVVPIPSLELESNTCAAWSGYVTYTATPMPASMLNELANNSFYSYRSHFHADGTNDGTAEWYVTEKMQGTPAEKLAQINDGVFDTPDPAPGARQRYMIQHKGTCAADEGLRECVGVFVAPQWGPHRSNQPTTFPYGVCVGVPPAGASCNFVATTSSIDLGTGGPGPRHGSTKVTVKCSRAVIYRISVLPGNADPVGLQITGMTAQGSPFPYVSSGTAINETLNVSVEATVSSEGTFSTQRILRIDIP